MSGIPAPLATGAARGVGALQPVMVSVHSPLTLVNSLPLPVRFHLTSTQQEVIASRAVDADADADAPSKTSDPEGSSRASSAHAPAAPPPASEPRAASRGSLASRGIKISMGRRTPGPSPPDVILPGPSALGDPSSVSSSGESLASTQQEASHSPRTRPRSPFSARPPAAERTPSERPDRPRRSFGKLRRSAGDRAPSGEAASLLPVASGSLGPAQTERVHALSPLAEWHLALAIEGYETSAPILLQHRYGAAPGARRGAHNEHGSDHASSDKARHRPDLVVELKSLRGQPPLRVHVHNRSKPGGSRDVLLYAPYWLVNRSGIPLAFREARRVTHI